MLTIYTTARPFRGHFATIQLNAIGSWLQIRPRPQVLLIGDEEGYPEAARELEIEHLPDVRLSASGTPLLDSMIEVAERHSTSEALLLVAADTILFDEVWEALAVAQRTFTRFCLVAGRRHVALTSLIDFEDPDWKSRLVRAAGKSRLDDLLAGDFFLYSRGLWRGIPPFAVGRTTADNWLYARARENGGALIDVTRAVMTIHQDHDYSHHTDGAAGVFFGEEARANRAMAGSHALMKRWDANWTMNRRFRLRRAGRLRRNRLILQYEILRWFRRLTNRS